MHKQALTGLGAIGRIITAITGPWTWANAKGWLKLIILVLIIRWIWFEPYKIPSGSMEPTLHGDPAFLRGDRVLVNKFVFGPRLPFTNMRVFRLGKPRRWDIVVFRPTHEDATRGLLGERRPLIKRVVGLPGERIHITGGKVYVNGEPQALPEGMPDVRYTKFPEPFIAQLQLIDNMESPEVAAAELRALRRRYRDTRPFRFGIMPDDQYSVVPDNSYFVLGDNSGQSLDGRYFGWVPNRHILGRAFCIYWPLGRRRDLSGFTQSPWALAFLYGLPALAAVYVITRVLLFRSYRIGTEGVAPLAQGDRVLVNHLTYGLRLPFTKRRVTRGRLPRRGELAVYCAPDRSEAPGTLLVGRIAGLPGEPMDPEGAEGPQAARVPTDHFFIMADGPGEAADSRAFGPVARENLIGSVLSVWWPLWRVRRLGV